MNHADPAGPAGNDNEETRLIVTKRGSYEVPVSQAQTWAQRYPGHAPIKGMEDHRFWPTPQGWVIARPDLDED